MSETAILSLLISLIFSEVFGFSPGGVIVPFYFALALDDPVKIISTLLTAFLSLLGVRILSGFTILYGKRKFTVYLVLGLLIKLLFSYAYFGNSYLFFHLSMTIGYLVPGILGRDMERQGILKTLLGLSIVVLLIRLFVVLLR